MDGIVNINKPAGMTSHDVVAQVRRITRQRRVGHTGTLDPLASGVLPLCLGQACRLAEYLSAGSKCYEARIVFGVVTDTGDAEGTVVRTAPVQVDRAAIEALLPTFLGKQQQLPPLYSAIKHHGQPLYKLAREGIAVDRQPRSIVIHRLTIRQWAPPVLTLEVECSKGTYIRSLAYDLGERAGCGAHLGGLVRLRSGPFSLEHSVSLEVFARHCADNTWDEVVYLPDEALLDHQAIIVGPSTEEHIRHGNGLVITGGSIVRQTASKAAIQKIQSGSQDLPLLRAYTIDGRFIGVLRWQPEASQWHPHKVLNLC